MSKRSGVSYIQQDEPTFLKQFKQRIGYKEGPNVDTKVILSQKCYSLKPNFSNTNLILIVGDNTANLMIFPGYCRTCNPVIGHSCDITLDLFRCFVYP
jgi:hypothetical protein